MASPGVRKLRLGTFVARGVDVLDVMLCGAACGSAMEKLTFVLLLRPETGGLLLDRTAL